MSRVQMLREREHSGLQIVVAVIVIGGSLFAQHYYDIINVTKVADVAINVTKVADVALGYVFSPNINMDTNLTTNQSEGHASGHISPKDDGWCVPSTLSGEDSLQVWDFVNGCCVRRLEEQNCALGRLSVLRYCYTANIGGMVLWATVDDHYLENISSYKNVLADMNKDSEDHKCDIEIYPLEVTV